ncbi:hypothetical protein TUM17576_27690 [Enterobacter hormaechei]|nr:hypothetical protein [Enterobacter hormaechei]GJL35949.1 hypothetical protein TUM17576_27690 [Enterobacter hormaechei]
MRMTSCKKEILSYFEPDNLEWVTGEIGAPPFDVSGVAYLLHGMVSFDKRHQLESTRRTLESMVAGGANGSRGGGKQGIPPQLYNETAAIGIVADTIRDRVRQWPHYR